MRGFLTIHSLCGQRLRMRHDAESHTRDFLDSATQLLTGHRR